MIPQNERVMGAVRPVEPGDAAPAAAPVAIAHVAAGASADEAEPAGRGGVAAAAAQRSADAPRAPVRRLALHFALVLLCASGAATWLAGVPAGASAALGVTLA